LKDPLIRKYGTEWYDELVSLIEQEEKPAKKSVKKK
jgi:hypothetical protein